MPTAPRTCALCPAALPTGLTDRFCPACRLWIDTGVREGTRYNAALEAGDVNLTPRNEQDARQIRDALKQRLRDQGSTPDCRLPSKRNPR